MTSLIDALQNSGACEPNDVINAAQAWARDHCRRLGSANPYLTTVAYDEDLDSPVAVFRSLDSEAKPMVVAAYIIVEHLKRVNPPGVTVHSRGSDGQPGVVTTYALEASEPCTSKVYQFLEIVGDEFARIAKEDFARRLADAPFELNALWKAVPEGVD